MVRYIKFLQLLRAEHCCLLLLQLVHEAKVFLSAAAALLLCGSVLHLVLGRHLYHLLGERRGAIAFLQVLMHVSRETKIS